VLCTNQFKKQNEFKKATGLEIRGGRVVEAFRNLIIASPKMYGDLH
jgi:hypothetical protein